MLTNKGTQFRVISDVVVSDNNESRDLTCVYPLTIATDEGALVCVYRRGQTKQSYEGVLVSQRSSDKGQTWSTPAIVCDKRHLQPPQSVNSGGVCQCADGSLLAVFKTTEVTQADHAVHSSEGLKQNCMLYSAKSLDGGRTWLQPQRLDTSPYARKIGVPAKPLLLPNGELLIPAEAKPKGRASTTVAAFSSDHGCTISPFTELMLNDPTNELSMCDARFSIINGRILALLWTFREDNEQTIQVRQAFSDDNGRSWSEPYPTGFLGQITAPLALGDSIVIAASNYRNQPEGIRLWL